MSLINEALKKAQRQRTEGAEQPDPAPNEAGATPAPRVARRDKPAGFRSQMMAAVGGGVVVLLLVVGGIWFLRPAPKTETPPPKPDVAAVHPTTPPPAATNATTTAPVATASAPAAAPATVIATPVTPPPAIETKPVTVAVVETPKPAPVSAAPLNPASGQFTLPLAPAPTSTATASTAAPTFTLPTGGETAKPVDRPKPPPHMVTIIENLRVAGIRAAGEDSKVLMNDRVYRLNDIVDHELGLKLTGVTAKSLTFEDDHGAVYTRQF